MRGFPPFRTLEGELLNLRVCAPIETRDAVALLYYCGGDEKACVVQPCSLALTQFQIHIGPLGRSACVEVPYMSIATWGIARASAAVTKAFTQVQLQAADEAAARAACGTPPTGATAASPTSAATATPLLSPAAGSAAQSTAMRPRYTDAAPALFVVTLQSKHVWQHRLIVQSERLLKNVRAHLTMAHCLARVTDMPAFTYAEERRRVQSAATTGSAAPSPAAGSSSSNANGGHHHSASHRSSGSSGSGEAAMWRTEFGWNLYSPRREFTRQLCLDATRPAPVLGTEAAAQDGSIGVQHDLRPWFHLVDLRDEDHGIGSTPAEFLYSCSPTYPELFLQPNAVDREMLLRGMLARSRARVPAVSYVCLRTGAVLARGSQPLMRSAALAADARVCHALINNGYAAQPAALRRSLASAAAAGAAATAPMATSPLAVTASTLAAAHHVRASISGSACGSPASPSAPRMGGGSTATTTAAAAAAVAAAAASVPRPVRPPSLFDEDSDSDSPAAYQVACAVSPAQPPERVAGPTAAAAAAGPGASSRHASATQVGRSVAATAATAAEAGNAATSPPTEPSHSPAPSTTIAAARILFVADCRPQITAAGNAQLGGGYESGSQYTFCETNFFEIDNIFGVTKAFDKLRGIIARYQGNTAEKTFLRRLYDSDWLAIVQRVLVCSVTAAQSLQSGVSCLVHCTDGWDRTSQCTALAMLLVDPYYRTIVGFCTLIEKEFCSFGHKFAERSGHQLPGRTSVQTHSGVLSSDTEHGGSASRLDTSPIFLHFLDAVYQVCRQYPTCFEFTPELLIYLSDAVYGCLYGTFLCNAEQERRLEGVRLRTASVWTDVLRLAQREKRGEVPLSFVNARYDAATAWRFISQRRRAHSHADGCGPRDGELGSGTGNGHGSAPPPAPPAVADFVLLPNCSSKRLVFWEDLYTREDADHYLSYNPNVHDVTVTQAISWGPEFDRFLLDEIADACAERVAEEASLTALEAFMETEPSRSTAALGLPGPRSAWCVFDSVNCFNCYKFFGMWSTKTQCPACKQHFCTDCHAHGCILQQY